jgi:RHS repeat-associated protein
MHPTSPFGEVLWEDGASLTDYTYTGQRSLSDIGLMDYNARFYDPMLGRFTSPDSIVPEPGSVIGFNRFAYVNNNPVRYTDPSGHFECENLSNNQSIDCEKVVNELLQVLLVDGGDIGNELYNVFQIGDNRVYCKGDSYCGITSDVIRVEIVDEISSGGNMEYNGSWVFRIQASLLNNSMDSDIQKQVLAGALGHEIRHLEQTQLFTACILAEIDAFDVQKKIYENMGIGTDSDTYNTIANEDLFDMVASSYWVSSLKGLSQQEVKEKAPTFYNTYRSIGLDWHKLSYVGEALSDTWASTANWISSWLK